MSELELHKQNLVRQYNKQYKNNLSRLNYDLIRNYRLILMSRIKNKNQHIRSLTQTYNKNKTILKQNLETNIKNVENFNPEFVVEKVNKKKALLIGINYFNTSYQLNGCVDDAHRMKDFLSNRGFTEFIVMTDELDANIKPTKQNILTEFKNSIVNANPGDILFFYFSGHGSYTYDKSGDETDGKDEMILSSDSQGVLDDELKIILSRYLKEDVTVFGLFDSCHSGTMFDLRFNYLDSNNFDKYTENDKVSECKGNVIMISGCMDNQTSIEAYINNSPHGALSWSFIECINKTPNCSWRELLKSIRDLLKTNSFYQIPQLSTDSFYNIDNTIFI